MSLVVSATLTFSATQAIVTDVTGNYNAISNPNGYGAPNAAFTDFAHYVILRKKNVNSVADVVMSLQLTNPLSDTVFPATRAVDGWYEANKINISKWLIGTAYTGGTPLTGSIVWDDNILYYCTVSNTGSKPSLNPSKWTAFTDLTTIEGNGSIISTIVGHVTAYNADVYWSKQQAALSQKGECGIPMDDKLKVRLDTIYRNIQMVLTADQLGNNTDGEWAALRLQNLGAK